MIGAFNSPKIKEGAREKLVATRLEIISDLPEEKRETIIKSRVEALKVAPELDQADRTVQERVLPRIAEENLRAFTSTWERVHKNAGN